MKSEFDLGIIGSGPGGYVAAIYAAKQGLDVAVIEKDNYGGVCTNWGCIPTKALLHSSKIFSDIQEAPKLGINVDGISFDITKMHTRKNKIVQRMQKGVKYLLENYNIECFRGQGKYIDKNIIEIQNETGKQRIKVDKSIIATGSSPKDFELSSLQSNNVFNSKEVLQMEDHCPEEIIIIGGGTIGVEFATIYNNLGSEVTILEKEGRIIPTADKDISQSLKRSLKRDGVNIHTKAEILEISGETRKTCRFKYKTEEKNIEGDIIFAAIGREPNIEAIGAKEIGLDCEQGFIKVNNNFETNIEDVYAIGDVTGGLQLAHEASYEGKIAVDNILGKDRQKKNMIPVCIYTNPEIAYAGLTETEARERGYNIEIGEFPVRLNGKATVMGEKEGKVKILTNSKNDQILGIHMISPHATDMISEIGLAMDNELTIYQINNIHPHPTLSESIMEAIEDIKNMSIHKP